MQGSVTATCFIPSPVAKQVKRSSPRTLETALRPIPTLSPSPLLPALARGIAVNTVFTFLRFLIISHEHLYFSLK